MSTRRIKPDISALEARLGRTFQDRELLTRALTHVSAPVTSAEGRAQTYQRLEFLGDRVLGVVVAEMLYRSLSAGDRGRTVDAAR